MVVWDWFGVELGGGLWLKVRGQDGLELLLFFYPSPHNLRSQYPLRRLMMDGAMVFGGGRMYWDWFIPDNNAKWSMMIFDDDDVAVGGLVVGRPSFFQS